MANYECTWRTNYFTVKDKELFKKLKGFCSADGSFKVFNDGPDDKVGLGGDGCPGCYPEYLEDDQLEELMKILRDTLGFEVDDIGDNMFFDILRKCVADDDAIIYKEAGHEKHRYVTTIGQVITSQEIIYIDLDKFLLQAACDKLGDPEWRNRTKMEY